MSKKVIFNALENKKSALFLPTQIFLTVVTLIAIANVIVSLWIQDTSFDLFLLIAEWFVVIVFTIEYFARIYVAKNKLAYIFSFWGIVDLISILPSFLGIGNLEAIKSLRLLKFVKPTKLIHSSKLSEIYKDNKNKN